jgi:hypothetical protein
VLWRGVEIFVGLYNIRTGLFERNFTPIGWTTMVIWGRGTRIPRWIAGSFYFGLGILLLCNGVGEYLLL